MFSAVTSLRENNELYAIKDEERGNWPEVTKSQLKRARLSVISLKAPQKVIKTLEIRLPLWLTT